MQNFKLVSRNCADFNPAQLADFGPAAAESVRAFHESFPMYTETPLASLPGAAAMLGLGEIYVKDESHRFGLNAFRCSAEATPWARYFPNACRQAK